MRKVNPRLSNDEKLYDVTNGIVEVMRDADLRPDEAINILLNLLARSSIIACIAKEMLIEGVAQTYDLHLEQDSKDETFN